MNPHKQRWSELIANGYWQEFSLDKVLHEEQTQFQKITVFNNTHFGNVMLLDDIVQTTEKDEFIYHEMLAHVPILAHGSVKRVLIIGGGDGGTLREVLRHKSIESSTLVEIDKQVIEISKRFLPDISAKSFSDSRVNIEIADGMDYLSLQKQGFDLIICDSSDPVGVGEPLFTKSFYRHCQRLLRDSGILVTQNGVAFFQLEDVQRTARNLNDNFNDYHFFSAAIPTYCGGIMAFGWGSNNKQYRNLSLETIHKRFEEANIETKYYTPEVHLASFALPQYVLDVMNPATNHIELKQLNSNSISIIE